MKNRYEIHGDTVVVFLKRREASDMEVLIDLADLPLVDSIPGSWVSAQVKRKHGTLYYACCGTYSRPDGRKGRVKRTGSVLLHRLIMGFPKSRVVDHKDFDGLNNRRSNLRICTPMQNCMHRSAGGAYFQDGRWQAAIRYSGRNRYLGRFDTREEAEAVHLGAALLADLLAAETHHTESIAGLGTFPSHFVSTAQ